MFRDYKVGDKIRFRPDIAVDSQALDEPTTVEAMVDIARAGGWHEIVDVKTCYIQIKGNDYFWGKSFVEKNDGARPQNICFCETLAAGVRAKVEMIFCGAAADVMFRTASRKIKKIRGRKNKK